MEEKIIYENNNEILILQVCEILKENGIPFIRRDEGAGSYLNATWGSNSGTKKIYVSSDDFNKADELLKIFNEDTQSLDEIEIPEELKDLDEEENDEYIQKEIKKYKNMKRILVFWIPFIFVMIFFICAAIIFITES